MVTPLRLMAVLAHPDDECLGMGGTLAKYAAEGVETYLVTATLGQSGRFHGIPVGGEGHPGAEALGHIRERELHAAAGVLGIREVALLGYHDQQLDGADAPEVAARIARQVRRIQPQVMATFPPDGSYGHPDHIAISQFTTAAAVVAADPGRVLEVDGVELAPHAISKLYYMAWPAAAMAAYEEAFRKMISRVDGVAREAGPWPDWLITTVISTREYWKTVWRAVTCHESQITAYERLQHLSPENHEALWGWQSYYRALSTVNGGRSRESDLFEGLR
jgi:LmbE family N-acetylglucosaminyl deacetylase